MLYERLPIPEVNDLAALSILQAGAPFDGFAFLADHPNTQGVQPGFCQGFLSVGEHRVR